MFTGLLLILLGVIFLLDRFDPSLGIGRLIRLYWPGLLILWGLAKLIDHLAARRTGQTRAPILSGGEAALLVLLAVILSAFTFRDWIRGHYPNLDLELPPFHQTYSRSEELAPRTIAAGARVSIETARGDITVDGDDGNELRVSVTKSAPASTDAAAGERMKEVTVVIEPAGDGYRIYPARQDDFRGRVSVGFEVHLPKTASVVAHTASGDIAATGIAGNLDVRAEHGDVVIHDAGADVTAALERGDARILGVAGNVRLTGQGDDVEIADVAGDATVDGAFIGSIRVRNVAKTTGYTLRYGPRRLPWSEVSVTQMTGQLELDAGDLSLSGVTGAAKVVTHNKDIDVENVAGRLDIANVHGDIKVAFATPPRADVNITNDAGAVEITLPAESSFDISAVSRSGDVESDFGDPSLTRANQGDTERFHGHFGTKPGAPAITIATSYGTIHLRKPH
jgi:DUF4097 and DUF4098 domain-containing protein YvlB